MFFIFFLYTECYCPNNISIEPISKFIVYSVMYEFSKQGWIFTIDNIINSYLFSVVGVFFKKAIIFLISDLSDITCKARKVIKYLQPIKRVGKTCAYKMFRSWNVDRNFA